METSRGSDLVLKFFFRVSRASIYRGEWLKTENLVDDFISACNYDAKLSSTKLNKVLIRSALKYCVCDHRTGGI